MNTTAFHLRTLLTWAEQTAAGEVCVGLVEWLASSPEAHSQWCHVQETLAGLQRGAWPADDGSLTPDNVARYVDGLCDVDEARRIEQACWNSKGDLQELLSGLQFRAQSQVLLARTPQLSERLAAIVPDPATVPDSKLVVRTMSLAARVVSNERREVEPHADPRVEIVIAQRVSPLARPRLSSRSHGRREWQMAAGLAAALIVVTLGVGWLFVSHQLRNGGPPPAAAGGDSARRQKSSPVESPGRQRETHTSQALADDRVLKMPRNADETNRDEQVDSVPDRRLEAPTDPIVKAPETTARRGPEGTEPQPPDQLVPGRVAPTQVAVRSQMGLVLVRSDNAAPWRVGQGKYSLQSPLRVVSVSESWTETQIPGVGTLVLAGESAATLSQSDDRVLQITLKQGHIGLRDLPANQRVRFEADGTQWTANGVGEYSTLALFRDFDAPRLLVSSGIIAVDSVHVAKDEVTTLRNGEVTPPQLLSARFADVAGLSANDPFDTRWLSPPADRVRKEWQTQHGKLLARLSAADDAVAEIGRMRAASLSGRQNALLARWNLMVADDAAGELWSMLNDRQEFVRQAGVSYLLELHPRLIRFREVAQGIRRKTGDATTQQIVDWLIRVHRNQPITAPQALELVEGLNHQELAVRQIAASLLEHQTRDAFRQARRKPPAYDAEAPPARRMAVQAQWQAIATQLFPANRRQRAGN